VLEREAILDFSLYNLVEDRYPWRDDYGEQKVRCFDGAYVDSDTGMRINKYPLNEY
jgi:hypothetical protein